jgi:hypothetical protein
MGRGELLLNEFVATLCKSVKGMLESVKENKG